jgi:hypothetical protein
MPLDPTGASLAVLILATLPPTEIPPSPAGIAANLAHWTAVSKAIVDYFIANTLVTLPVAGVATIVAPPGGGPCTGTGTGTIS